MLQRFSQRKLQIHLRLNASTMMKNERRRWVDPPGPNRRNPVHLGALSGFKVQRQKGRPRSGTHLAHERLEDGVAPLVAAFLELLEKLLGRVIMLCQQADNVALNGSSLLGRWGWRRA